MEEPMRLRLEPDVELQRLGQRLDDALGTREAALADAGDVNRLRRQPPVRLVHPCDLEERDVLVPELDVPARGLDEAREQRRPENRKLNRDRLEQPQRSR